MARITRQDGPAIVYREDGHRYTPIKFSVRGRDLKSAILEAQQKIHDKVKLDKGVYFVFVENHFSSRRGNFVPLNVTRSIARLRTCSRLFRSPRTLDRLL